MDRVLTIEERDELRQANEYVDYWKRQLRLDHIDFEVILYSPEENNGHLAECKIAFGRHRQKIVIRNPLDRSDRDRIVFRRDLEVVIVHELIHTKETPWRDHPSIDDVFQKDKWLTGLHEDSMDAIAEALVRARRGMQR